MKNGTGKAFAVGPAVRPSLQQWDGGQDAGLLQLQGAAVTAASNAIMITDRTGNILWVNPAFSALTGFSPEESIGRNPRDLVKSGRHEREVYQRLWATVLGGRTWRGELENRRKDGSVYTEYQTITPVCDAHFQITHFIAIKQDLTEAKRASAALSDAETRYRLLFEHSPDGILVFDEATGRPIEFNEAAHRLLGYSREEFAHLTIADFEAAESPTEIKRRIAGVMREGRDDFETRLRTREGEIREIHVTAQFTRAHGRSVLHCVWRDITERKAAERARREQSEIISHSNEGVMIVELSGRIQLWNHGAENIFGWTAAEAVGRSPEELLGHVDPEFAVKLRQEIARQDHSEGEFRARIRDGRERVVSYRTTLVRGENGEPLARLSFLADVTDKKLLEEKFLQSQRLENVGMLAAGIAHDLNNVLAPIVFAAPLLRGSLTEAKDLRVLEILERSANRGTGLVRQILGFSRGTTGEFQTIQVKHLARDILEVIGETFPKSIRQEHHIPTDLWPVLGDPTQIHQVLLNLSVNARDAMPQGGTLRITADNVGLAGQPEGPEGRPGAWLRLEVSDTGTGIPPDILERMWTPFFTTKGVGKGTGLGLSTVRGIVANHHGLVDVKTEIGCGTTFRIFLPAIAEETAPANPALSPAAPEGRGELILVVDDDESINSLISTILQRHGYRVLCAHDGVEALGVFAAHLEEISLVVTDFDMPLLGGDGLAQQLRQLEPDLRILTMSGLSRNAAAEAGRPDTVASEAFLLKPFTGRDLLAAVGRSLCSATAP